MFCIVIVVILCDSAFVVCKMINWLLSIKITFYGSKWPMMAPKWPKREKLADCLLLQNLA